MNAITVSQRATVTQTNHHLSESSLVVCNIIRPNGKCYASHLFVGRVQKQFLLFLFVAKTLKSEPIIHFENEAEHAPNRSNLRNSFDCDGVINRRDKV
jgi:hypothetical protein